MSNIESLNSKDLVSVRKADLERLLKIDIGTLSTAIYKLTVELFAAYVYMGINS